MQYEIRWKNLSERPDVKNYLDTKLEKFEKFKFVKDTAKVELVYYDADKTYTARVTISLNGHPDIHSEAATTNDIYTAINEMVEKTLDQLRRAKDQMYNNKRH